VSGFGEERMAPSNGIELAYQEMGDPDGKPLLLIMGLGTQMIAWDERLCAMLVERGFRVVRFDNRDIGRSTLLDGAGVPSRLELILGRPATAPYLLTDMAADTAGLMDHLGIDAAHLVGASMGGMIAQTMAIERPERVVSMTSIMSTTGRRWMEFPTMRAFAVLMTPARHGRDAYIEQAVKTFRVIGSPDYPMDEERLRDVVGRSYDRGHRPSGVLRQMHAISASGDRTSALRRVTAPTLVIHGRKDPLARPVGGRATAKAVPNARLRMIEGMGHDLPKQLWPTFVEEISSNAARAGTAGKAQAAAA
jgi:pimeloyl-ACP methyl ester carboxylesterase